jgi:hypothetical protein
MLTAGLELVVVCVFTPYIYFYLFIILHLIEHDDRQSL